MTSTNEPKRLLIVESLPDGLFDHDIFDSERDMVATRLGVEDPIILSNPTRDELREQIKDFQPEVIHLAGFDIRQTYSMRNVPVGRYLKDAFLLRQEDGSDDPVNAVDLAGVVNAARLRPELVACNFWHSAPRICAMAIAHGTDASIGFQDEFDDPLAELFFSTFYYAWRRSSYRTHLAFEVAQELLRTQPRGLTGSGIVLWSSRSILSGEGGTDVSATARRRSRARRPKATPATADASQSIETPEDLSLLLKEEETQDFVLPGGEHPREFLKVEVEPFLEVNYSLLHNNRGLFKKFILRKIPHGVIRDIEVEVKLYVGGDSFPFKMLMDLAKPIDLDLPQLIRVPLTSALGRGLRESVRTTLYVSVGWRGRDILRKTLPVSLLAIDEWRDDDLDRIWLPSFVLPRDPAVARIIDSAQKYLMVLLDDSGAGFDGYQSIEEAQTDESGSLEDKTEPVDRQVQAIWSSLLHDMPLGYINPPPTYTKKSQRLRTPSDIVAGRRGTCIDLTLLLAACLEYIDIYPVIFLLDGHAFPGYWRTETSHRHFVQARPMSQPSSATPGAPGVTAPVNRSISRASAALSTSEAESRLPASQEEAWYLGRDYYDEVMGLVYSRELVPIESVWLTHRGSFWEAIDQGMENLRSRGEFQALIDLKLARTDGVTPLPIHREDSQ